MWKNVFGILVLFAAISATLSLSGLHSVMDTPQRLGVVAYGFIMYLAGYYVAYQNSKQD